MRIESSSLILASHLNVADASGATKDIERLTPEDRNELHEDTVSAEVSKQQPAYTVRISEAAQAMHVAEPANESELVEADIPQDIHYRMEKIRLMSEAISEGELRILTPDELESSTAAV